MPNLPWHIHLAHQAAERLDWGSAHDHVGSLYLGSTAPDIRAMTKWPREQTHFAGLSVEEVGSGARRMFELHPELADPDSLTPATRAFVLGYISHLVADETWITTMFRPHFDPQLEDQTITSSAVEAHIWDRALQLDMDRKSAPEMGGFAQAVEAITGAGQEVEVSFLGAEVLLEWQEWVGRFMGLDFTWDRLKRALNRMYRDDDDVQQAVDGFLEQMPQSLERIYTKIPAETVAAYQKQALEQTVLQAREFFGEA
ncbi:MAG: zinc dependent phospholipase C family protein [Chloroflexi bacterium]|nr:zinc dependent phospholipase C family protein [Chloroflexota bacterium]